MLIQSEEVKEKYIPSMDSLKFIEKSRVKYGEKYDYSHVSYKGSKIDVKIGCPVHGFFYQKPNYHLKIKGVGCSKCGVEQRARTKTLTTDMYISKALLKHKGKYSYENTVYTNNKDLISITCKIHGEFHQRAYAHLYGQGCPKCGIETISKVKSSNPDHNGWKYSNWRSAGESSKLFRGYKVYIIKCWNENEEFIKIGKTFNDINIRFNRGNLPYNFAVVKVIEGSAEFVSKLEEELHRNLKNNGHIYTPLLKFNGCRECYSVNYKDIL